MKKKLVVIYGNCHTAVIKEYLNSCSQFLEKYVICPLEYIQNIEDISYIYKNSYIKKCDVFIHQSIQKNNRYGECFSSENIIKLLKKDCKIISIPNVYHLPICFFPQYRGGNEFLDRKGNPVFFRDKIIDSIYGRYGYKKVFKVYSDPEIFSDYDFAHNFSLFIERVRKRELDWDIKVSDFILNNYKEKHLFYDPNHPTNVFMEYVVCELLSILGITNASFSKSSFEEMDTFEMPLYNSTKKYLSLNYELKNNIRNTGRKLVCGKMTIEEYIKQYLAMEWQNDSISIIKRFFSLLLYIRYKIKSVFIKLFVK